MTLTASGVVLDDYLNVYDYVKTLHVESIWVNDQKTSYALMENIPNGVRLIKGMTPVAYTKCVKNEKEQENIKGIIVINLRL